ncbi:MAG: tRNA glutamyl-Q(34) synthetase GluQRS [Alphaproteobacteria bacterium HGW-Alphaproteobacteria-4]|nr:MAG: tRNA glutamyl-Q(34) synthetase GluQRS [Alphaproteobacteria bacterium HGW-Alphaproteobacteria-4]
MACRATLKRTRFAPSPTGPLHLGHAYAALVAQSRADPGQFLLRIEDIDRSRCRPTWEAAIYDDLAWLGLAWQTPVWRQSDRLPAYRSALNHLISLGLCYPCRCRRADIRAALSAPQEGGPDGPCYPGTCRDRTMHDATPTDAIRLNMARALAQIGASLSFTETGAGTGGAASGVHALSEEWLITTCGDIIISRRDLGTSYHLAVVVDDAAQGITEVTRGEDLFAATQIHRVLQALLGLPTPLYHHHPLIRDEFGKRLAKRDDARALAKFRAEGATAQDIRRMVGL